MNEGLQKFRELLLTDEAFQQKLKAALETYNGEQTEEAVFNSVLVPLAAEYGLFATYDEFRDFVSEDQKMDNEELAQIAGGKTGGIGKNSCLGIGIGIGAGGGDGSGGVCFAIGGGWGDYECLGSGDVCHEKG